MRRDLSAACGSGAHADPRLAESRQQPALPPLYHVEAGLSNCHLDKELAVKSNFNKGRKVSIVNSDGITCKCYQDCKKKIIKERGYSFKAGDFDFSVVS